MALSPRVRLQWPWTREAQTRRPCFLHLRLLNRLPRCVPALTGPQPPLRHWDCLTIPAAPATSAEQPPEGPVELPTLPLQGPCWASSLVETPLLSSCLRALSSSTLTALFRRASEGRGARPLLQVDPISFPQLEASACGQALCPGIQWVPFTPHPTPYTRACMDFSVYLKQTSVLYVQVWLPGGRTGGQAGGRAMPAGGVGRVVRPLTWPVGPASPFLLPGPPPLAASLREARVREPYPKAK